jgi:hypothetical protein
MPKQNSLNIYTCLYIYKEMDLRLAEIIKNSKEIITNFSNATSKVSLMVYGINKNTFISFYVYHGRPPYVSHVNL